MKQLLGYFGCDVYCSYMAKNDLSLQKVTVQFTVKQGEERKVSLFLCAHFQINAIL